MTPTKSGLPERPPEFEGRITLNDVFGDSYWHLTQKIRNGEYVSPDRIANARRDYPNETPSPEFTEYAEKLARGEIKKPRGPKPNNTVKYIWQFNLAMELSDRVDRYHDWLRKRKKRFGLRGWSYIRDADWWQGPPRERAYRMAMARARKARKIFRRIPIEWRHASDLCARYR